MTLTPEQVSEAAAAVARELPNPSWAHEKLAKLEQLARMGAHVAAHGHDGVTLPTEDVARQMLSHEHFCSGRSEGLWCCCDAINALAETA